MAALGSLEQLIKLLQCWIMILRLKLSSLVAKLNTLQDLPFMGQELIACIVCSEMVSGISVTLNSWLLELLTEQAYTSLSTKALQMDIQGLFMGIILVNTTISKITKQINNNNSSFSLLI